MKNCLLYFLFSIIGLKLSAQLSLIPWPNKVEQLRGKLQLSGTVTVAADSAFSDALEELRTIFSQRGIQTQTNAGAKKAQIVLTVSEKGQAESYTLSTKGKITIEAKDPKGAFYAVKTLKQLLTNATGGKSGRISIPVVLIEDQPAYAWRAFMLDEARYFKGMDVVKKLLDDMADLKMNVFHWHLTDDQGWRIAIRRFSRLAEVGGKRKNSQTGGWESTEYNNQVHEGFYTQEQIREIVQYAAQRQIDVVPEIEMPGHSAAAIAAYPWLGMLKDSSIQVPGKFGKHPEVLDVTDVKVIWFYEEILKEVMELFPYGVIHIGGDEVNFGQWKNSEKVQAYMKKNKLATPGDLQVHFTNRISQFISSKGKRMMGWNDVLGGKLLDWQGEENMKVTETLAPNTIIHFWKGDEELMRSALSKGFALVNSNEQFTYLDYSLETTPLEKAYGFNPLPEGLPESQQKQLLGLGCQMWGEWIPDVSIMNKRIYPRIAAFAETGWTQTKYKNFERFKKGLQPLQLLTRE